MTSLRLPAPALCLTLLQCKPGVSLEVLGQSTEGRDMEMVRRSGSQGLAGTRCGSSLACTQVGAGKGSGVRVLIRVCVRY